MDFQIVNDFPNEIMDQPVSPCISLYQPTHRHRPENMQDRPRFRNLVRVIEESLLKAHARKVVQQILEPFHALAKDTMFWNHTQDGLAVLANRERGIIYELQRPVKEFAVVADSFHTKPLIRVFQSADRYHVLGLSAGEFALYEGNRYGLGQIQLEDMVRTGMAQAPPERGDGKSVVSARYSGTEATGLLHGHGDKSDEKTKDLERFFRYVDRFVWENFSRHSGLPLLLVSLAEHHSVFRGISRNPQLLKGGVRTSFNAMSPEALRESVWKEIEPEYLERTKRLVERFEVARAEFLASDDLSDIAMAAQNNRIATLLVESDRIVPGKVSADGRLLPASLDHPQSDDVLDDLAEMVLKAKGQVVLLPADRMPTTRTGCCAVFRY